MFTNISGKIRSMKEVTPTHRAEDINEKKSSRVNRVLLRKGASALAAVVVLVFALAGGGAAQAQWGGYWSDGYFIYYDSSIGATVAKNNYGVWVYNGARWLTYEQYVNSSVRALRLLNEMLSTTQVHGNYTFFRYNGTWYALDRSGTRYRYDSRSNRYVTEFIPNAGTSYNNYGRGFFMDTYMIIRGHW